MNGPCFSCGHDYADHDGGQQCDAVSGYCMCQIYLTAGDQPMQRIPWTDEPPAPGYYWFCVNPSRMMHGPTLVRLRSDGILVTHASDSSEEKPCAYFQRSWAGPLPVPDDWRDELSELRALETRKA